MQPEHFISIIGLMFAIVVTLVGWIGNRLHRKMDDLSEKMESSRLNIGERVAKVESSIDHLEQTIEHMDDRLARIERRA